MFITVKLDQQLIARNISMDELSARIGVSQADLSLLKRIKIRDPRFAILQQICKELNCKPFDIIEFNCEEVSNDVSQINA